jgi:ubiquinone/menaquinone biosynthesis C-methylase UbiE
MIAGMTPSQPESDLFDRFAQFYDNDYRDYDDDIEAIVILAAECGDPILELGCGTGRVLLPLAVARHSVTGVDVSPALLARAEEKVHKHGVAANVRLVRADLRTLDLPEKQFAFAFCTSNTLMHFTSAEEQIAVLRNAARHLRPGGRLLIDLFNPDLPRLFAVEGMMELADRWQDAQSGADVLKWSVRRVDVAEQLQETTFIYEEIFADGRTQRTVCPFTLRFLWRSEAELMLQTAGLRVEDVLGSFDGDPYGSDSAHLILIAVKQET